MRKLASITGLSLVVIVGALAAAAFLPPIREMVKTVVSLREPALPWETSTRELQRQVAQRPDDVQAWLALATAAGNPPGSVPLNEKAFARVLSLRPQWPAAYLALGTRLMGELPPVWRPELSRVWNGNYTDLERERPPWTPPQRLTAQRAREVLTKARALDPGNAAPDYLLAYLALEQGRDGEGLALLRSGMSKERWSLGRRETTIAAYETALHWTSPLDAHESAMVVAATSNFGIFSRLRELARLASAMSLAARARGDHGRAIMLNESAMHLGDLMMSRPYTVIDALVGRAVWAISASERLTPAEQQAVNARLLKSHAGARRPEFERQARLQARCDKLARYLRAHRRPDLADRVLAESKALSAWREQRRAAVGSGWRKRGSLFSAVATLGAALLAAAYALGVLIICGFAYLMLALVGRRPLSITWARWKWLMVMIACFGLPLAAAARWGGPLGAPFDGGVMLDDHASWPLPWGDICVIAGLPLIILSAAFITWRVRRGQEPAERPGFGRQYVGTLTAVLLPVVALTLATTTPVAILASAKTQKETERLKVMIYESEFTYIGMPPPPVVAERHSARAQ